MFGRRVAVGLAVAAIVVAACGGGSSPAPAGSATAGGGSSSAPAVSPAAGGGANGGPVAAGGDLCGLLGPGDFAAVGVSGTGTPTENNPDASNVYCVYAGKSAGTGGVEFDAFLADTSADSGASFVSASEGLLDFEGAGKAAFPDANDAKLRNDVPDGYAAIAIWKGKLVFVIGIPTTDKSQAQLIALAKLVLERAAVLT